MGSQPRTAAMRSRDSSRSRRAACPPPWMDEALPTVRGCLEPGVAGLGAERRCGGVVQVHLHATIPPSPQRRSGLTTVERMVCPEPSPTLAPPSGILRPELDDLGVRLHDGGGTLRVWSENADAIELEIFDDTDLDWITDSIPLEPAGDGVWSVTTSLLRPGTRYAIRVSGSQAPGNTFNPRTLLIEPYARGLVQSSYDAWRSVVVDGGFDWGGVQKPRVPLDRTVIYEGHLKGLTKRHPRVPPALHGTYAGLAHPAMIEHFHSIGVTTIELLPIHAFQTEPRLLQHGLANYWGYNTLNFFTPHAPVRDRPEPPGGTGGGAAGVQGHGAAAARGGARGACSTWSTTTPRRRASAARARACAASTTGRTTGSTTTARTSTSPDAATASTRRTTPPARLVLDSLRYWANDVQIDGFRFDLAATLGRDAAHTFTPGASAPAGHQGRPGARRDEAHRRAVGRRHGRLADRQLRRRLARVERPLPRSRAQLLAERRRLRAPGVGRPRRASAASRRVSPAPPTRSASSGGRSPASTSSRRTTASPCATSSRTT